MQKINIDQVKNLPGSTASLFDIKTVSEPTAQKGWCCISDNQPKRLIKANVPTAYNFLKDKFDNADGTISPLSSIYNNYYPDKKIVIINDTVYFYIGSNKALYKANINDFADTTKWVKICDTPNYNNWGGDCAFDIENKLFGITGAFIDIGRKGYIFDLENGEQIAEFELQPDYHYTYTCCFFENCFYVGGFTSTYRYNLNNSTYEEVYNNFTIYGNQSRITEIFAHNDNYYYFNVTKEGGGTHSVRASDIMDKSTYHLFTSGDEFYVGNGFCCKYNNRLYAPYQNAYNNYSANNYIDLSNDTVVRNVPLMIYNFVNIYTVYWGYIIQTTDGKYLFTTNFQSFTILCTFSDYSFNANDLRGCDSNGGFVVLQYYSTIYCSAPNKTLTVYTDTINGIDIKYYKNGDWKICTPNIAVGNDNNLQDVFEYLGYLNYWWIDTANEQITLQRNSNMWTMMYVGDDYEDSSLPSGNYLPFTTKPIKLTNITASNWIEDNTFEDYGYKCEITCNGVNENMFAQVVFGIEEASSSNYASVCDTAENKVIIYSKVNDTITIPTIVIMEA